MRRRRIFSLAAGMLALVVFRGASVTSAAALPPLLDCYVNQYVQLDAAAHERLLAGQPVTRLLDADPSKEVAIFGAVWIDAPIARRSRPDVREQIDRMTRRIALDYVNGYLQGGNESLAGYRDAERPTFVARGRVGH